jgi:hypothetical protein
LRRSKACVWMWCTSLLDSRLKLTFDNLKKWKWKLNPNKCVFGVPLGNYSVS